MLVLLVSSFEFFLFFFLELNFLSTSYVAAFKYPAYGLSPPSLMLSYVSLLAPLITLPDESPCLDCFFFFFRFSLSSRLFMSAVIRARCSSAVRGNNASLFFCVCSFAALFLCSECFKAGEVDEVGPATSDAGLRLRMEAISLILALPHPGSEKTSAPPSVDRIDDDLFLPMRAGEITACSPLLSPSV